MKKILIIVVVLVVVVGVGAFIFSLFQSPPPTVNPGGNGTGQISIPGGLVAIQGAPTSTLITLNTPKGLVTMNNFYKTALGANDQFIVLTKDSAAEITYDPGTNVFYLDGAQAEAKLLTILGMGQSDACKLIVSKSTGKGLSFCTGGAF